MTQKSVSIRANVSIRGVTIRAYALYIQCNVFTRIHIYVVKTYTYVNGITRYEFYE